MRQFSLCAICLALCFCGTVSAQQGLVQLNDNDDPCAMFKMQILVPDNHVDIKRRGEKLKDGIDPKMVWNPCPQAAAQFALVLPERKRDQLWKFPVPQSFGVQASTVKSGPKTQAEFLFPQRPSPFDKLLRQ